MKQQQGFTLIELIVVIVILGILAATALPRFAGLEKDARYAAAKGLLGSVQSASSIVHAKILAAGSSVTAATDKVNMEGTNVDTVFGYPAATAAGIGMAAGLVNGQGYTIDYVATPNTITPDGASSTCRVSYAAASAAAFSPTVTLTATTSASCG